MNLQDVLTTTPVLKLFLKRILSSPQNKVRDEVLRRLVIELLRRKNSGDAESMSSEVIRRLEDTARAESSRPPMLHTGAELALLMMVRNRPVRSRSCWRELRLPRGCTLAVRYASR